MKYDVVVIGGGPAGMLAAGKAALEGAKVALVEKNSELGLKLLKTGSGRCHITNDAQRIQFQHKVDSGAEFLETALKHFSPRKFLLFLEGLGIAVEYGKEGVVYPRDNNSTALVAALVKWVESLGVTALTNTEVLSLVAPAGEVTGVIIKESAKESTLETKAAIIATGGLSCSEAGATGDGYRLAEVLGHEIIPPVPSLVPIKLGEPLRFKPLVGLHLPGVRLYAWIDGKKVDDREGDLIFTESGITGPTALDISRVVSKALAQNEKISVTLDFIPKVDEGDLEKELVELFSVNGTEKISALIKHYVPARLTEFLVKSAGFPLDSTGGTISTKQRKNLRTAIKRLELPIISTEHMDSAQVTAGGVSLEGINPETMGSYVCSGLFFAGEVMDVDAQRGGYNLQIAWSTGRLAGESAVRV